MENYVNIEFYVDEFVNVYDGDKDLKPILDLLNWSYFIIIYYLSIVN